MKKYFKMISIAVLGLLLFGACKKGKNTYIIPAAKRYLASVTDQTGKTVAKVTYYDDKKIKKFTSGDAEYRYVYDSNGRVSSLFIKTDECKYSYNSSGRILSFTINGQTYPVTYNHAENTYSFNTGTTLKLYLDVQGNCTRLVAGDNNDYIAHFFYQGNRKGALTNGGNMSLTHIIFPEPMFLKQSSANMLSIPLDGYEASISNATSISRSYINEYDSENFLIKSTVTTTEITGNKTETTSEEFTYHYIEL